MRFFLIRHGQSLANVDFDVYKQVADHDIKLTEKGLEESKQIGLKLLNFLNAEKSNKESNINDKLKNDLLNVFKNFTSGYPGVDNIVDSINGDAFKIWNSPYLRARETSNIVSGILKNTFRVEDPLLSEQQYGLFNGLTDSQISELYPNEFNMFKLQTGISGNFFSRIPMGESPFDVYCRLRVFIEKLYRQEDMVTNHIIICHGAVVKLLSMALLDKPFEYYDSESEPGNCFVRLIEYSPTYSGVGSCEYVDRGYIIKP
jgi:2,3-bisphosphoglycerate-dependent phosphoglycerate mutase